MSAATWSADRDDDRWSVHAECRDVDPELFFFGGESAAYAYQIEEARAVCSGCLVAREGLNYAIRARADFGMWGGTTPVPLLGNGVLVTRGRQPRHTPVRRKRGFCLRLLARRQWIQRHSLPNESMDLRGRQVGNPGPHGYTGAC